MTAMIQHFLSTPAGLWSALWLLAVVIAFANYFLTRRFRTSIVLFIVLGAATLAEVLLHRIV